MTKTQRLEKIGNGGGLRSLTVSRHNNLQQSSNISASLNFVSPCEDTISFNYSDTNALLVENTACVTAPVLTAYVIWVLKDALKNKISTLYFLARDGLAIYKIASVLCDTWKLPIKCKYLYCSRFSLRAPLYVINKHYAVEKMCQCMFDTHLNTVFMRGGIPEEYFEKLSEELSIPLNKRLKSVALNDLGELLLSNKTFDHLATEQAKHALEKTVAYLEQEIDETETYAIVDTGWSGSVQQCFTMLKKHVYGNDAPPMIGYYFGLFRHISEAYGKYNCFLFYGKYNAAMYPWFNNILFECICTADHGMTLGYEHTNGRWTPVLAELERPERPTEWSAERQLDLYSRYAKNFVRHNPGMPQFLGRKDLTRMVIGLLKPFMHKPTFEEATFWGSIPFTDDTNPVGYSPIARTLSIKDIRMKSFTHSLARIITKGRGSNHLDLPVYWKDGSLALSQSTIWQRIDMLALEWLYRLLMEG